MKFFCGFFKRIHQKVYFNLGEVTENTNGSVGLILLFKSQIITTPILQNENGEGKQGRGIRGPVS